MADTVSDSTLFARVGAILFEGKPAARRVKIDGPEGDSMVSPGRTGTGYHGYGRKGGRLITRSGKSLPGTEEQKRQRLRLYTQVDSTGRIPQPKKS